MGNKQKSQILGIHDSRDCGPGITHDFGLYRWSSLFYAWHFCLAVITHRVLSSFHFFMIVVTAAPATFRVKDGTQQ
jgi:hypothetical protein